MLFIDVIAGPSPAVAVDGVLRQPRVQEDGIDRHVPYAAEDGENMGNAEEERQQKPVFGDHRRGEGPDEEELVDRS